MNKLKTFYITIVSKKSYKNITLWFCWFSQRKNSDKQKQPPTGVLKKRCSENMQQIYRRTPMPKSDFNYVAFQLYWNHTTAWVFSCKFAAYCQNTFLRNTSGWLLLGKVDRNFFKENKNAFYKCSSIKFG